MTSVGDRVTRGQVLVVLEAMKTVFRLSARGDTVVASVSCAAGEMVQEGQMLVGFGEAGTNGP
jgi:3-methylcrotonyl-CoA carboxylase alpha subunit